MPRAFPFGPRTNENQITPFTMDHENLKAGLVIYIVHRPKQGSNRFSNGCGLQPAMVHPPHFKTLSLYATDNG